MEKEKEKFKSNDRNGRKVCLLNLKKLHKIIYHRVINKKNKEYKILV